MRAKANFSDDFETRRGGVDYRARLSGRGHV